MHATIEPPPAVKLAVNEKALVNNLRHAFTNKAILFRELLQNTDRAGATGVWITTATEGAGSISIEIIDNGCGIADMSDLLSVATSGWSDDIKQSRRPYGLGFLSAVYAARGIEVCSAGRKLAFVCKEVLDFLPAPVLDDPESAEKPGCRIVLHGLSMSEKEAIESIKMHATGFPLPVHLNGAELDRPHALNEAFVACDIGHIRIPDMHGGHPKKEIEAYLQGFCVYRSHRYALRGHPDSVVLHLDPRMFVARLPDRDVLIDESEQTPKMHSAIAQLWQSHLEQARQEMVVTDFIDRYEYACRKYHPDLLNQLDWLPRQWVRRISEAPIQWESELVQRDALTFVDQHIQQADLASGKVRVATGSLPNEENMPAWAFAYHQEWLYLSSAPPGHWIHAYSLDLDEMMVEVSCQVRATGQFNGFITLGEIRLCESYVLTGRTDPEAHGTLPQVKVSNLALCVPAEGVFYVPDGEGEDPSWVVRQADNYLDTFDKFQEERLNEDQTHFYRKVLELRGTSPEHLLQNLMEDSLGLVDFPALHGKRFEIHISEMGISSVTPV